MNEPPPIESLYQGRFLELVRQGRWEFARRTNARGAAVIVPTTDEGKLVLVEQFRAPLGATAIEFPAGIVGDEADSRDEPLERAAARELEEETGYRAGGLEVVATVASSPGLTDETYALILATRLAKVSAGGGVGHEDIKIHEVPAGQIDSWLAAQQQRGAVIAAQVYAGLRFLGRGQQ